MTGRRGGKRPGAGRPRGSTVLNALERLGVGAECQERWSALYAESLRAAEEAVFAGSEYARQIAAINRVPLVDRPDYLPVTTPEGTPAIDEDGCQVFRKYVGEAHADDIEGARKQLAGMEVDDPAPAPKLIQITAKRPYRAKRAIVEEVSKWATAAFGRHVSERMVESCWGEFRDFQNRTG